MTRSLVAGTHASTCYFRTSVAGDGRKAMIQITERCNLHCAHCSLSAKEKGLDLSADELESVVLPRLLRARVKLVTLTGGEPFAHPQIRRICAAVASLGLPLGICTNATLISDEQIGWLARLGGVHLNVSFDGFRPGSHGRFRGNTASFEVTLRTARRLGEAGLLQGLICTPNTLTGLGEYAEMCEFAVAAGARYVMLNPLAAFGRGVRSQGKLAAGAGRMRQISGEISPFRDRGLEVVPVRFPNSDLPLGGCKAGKMIFVFADGATTPCPYLVIAARTPRSRYAEADFVAGNVLREEIGQVLDGSDLAGRLAAGTGPACAGCGLRESCGGGCPAAVIASGGRIGDRAAAQCPAPTTPA